MYELDLSFIYTYTYYKNKSLLYVSYFILYLLLSNEKFYIHSGGSLEYQINSQIMIMLSIQFFQFVKALSLHGWFSTL